MANSILICLITFLSCGFLLNVGLLYIDARLLQKDRYKWGNYSNSRNQYMSSRLVYSWHNHDLDRTKREGRALLARRGFSMQPPAFRWDKFRPKTLRLKQLIWISHAITILTAPDIFLCTKDKNLCFFNEPALLSRVSVASLISLALCHHYLQLHKIAGARRERNSEYIRLMMLWIIANGAAALCQLVGEIIYYSLSHARKQMSTNLRQGIFLACLFAQLLNSFGVFIKGIEERMAQVSSSRSTRNRNSDVEGAVRLNSL